MPKQTKIITLTALATLLSLHAMSAAPAGSAIPASSAEEKTSPKTPLELVQTTIDEALDILQDPTLKAEAKKTERREKIRTVLLDVFDMDTVAALSLSTYRKKFSPEELEKFTEVFSRLLFVTYISHIEIYSDEEVQIGEPKTVTATKIVVPTTILSKNGPIPVDYSLFKAGDHWKVYDVKIEGVSLVKNYRSQFREILVKRKPAELIKQLEKKASKNEENS